MARPEATPPVAATRPPPAARPQAAAPLRPAAPPRGPPARWAARAVYQAASAVRRLRRRVALPPVPVVTRAVASSPATSRLALGRASLGPRPSAPATPSRR